MPILEIITIGTELLLGEITDTNSTYIARTLRDHGIDIYRITTIGDNPGRITKTIQEALERADIIITTGGLGPTVDDPTRLAVANAANRQLVFHDDLWDQIIERFKAYGREPTENNRRQAYIPEDAIPIHNLVGTAPCFIVEQDSSYIISLPGVPQEMKYILHNEIIPFLKKRFDLKTQIIKAAVLHVASMGESVIDEIIADLENYANPTVGLLAHPGQVDIRVTAKAGSDQEANEMIAPILEDLHNRLGENIYGSDAETLGGVIAALLQENNHKLRVLTYGFDEIFSEMIKPAQADLNAIHLEVPQPPKLNDLTEMVRKEHENSPTDLIFGAALLEDELVTLHLAYQDGKHNASVTRKYGGPREYARLWADHIGLDFLRRNLINITGYRERKFS
jgi:competence/damage-inducible protein CinA-like protein